MSQVEYTDKDGEKRLAYPVVLIEDQTPDSVEGLSITQFLDTDGRPINATPLMIMEDRRTRSSVEVKQVQVVNDLSTGGSDAALSADMGKALQDSKYELPSSGIPSASMSSAVQASLAKADTSIPVAHKGAANGVATLGSDGKLPLLQVPDIAVVKYLGEVASEAEMTTLDGQSGDWCVRTDSGTVFIVSGDPASASGWMQMAYPAAPVSSVSGKTGVVTLMASDVGAAPAGAGAGGALTAADVQGLGSAATEDATAFATSDQGNKADMAVLIDPSDGRINIASHRDAVADAAWIAGGVGAVRTVDARDFGIYPGKSNAFNAELKLGIEQAAADGRVLELQPGTYNKDTTQSPVVSGGAVAGIVCLTGRAKVLSQDPAYTNNAIYFNASSANRLKGLWIKGVDFTTPTRPDVGMINGANELSHFVHLTNVDNILIEDCRAMHNTAGFVLLRHCTHAMIRGNRVIDVWKDGMHTTGDSHDIWRVDNVVYGPGDDAYATVAYLTGTGAGIPTHIYDINNRVYGGRRGRGFAYVGCRHVRMRNSYFDGRLPADIPQQDVDGYYLRGSCGLYVASESGYQTHGVTDFEGDIQIVNAGPSRNAAKSWPTGTVNGIDWGINSYAPVHLSAGNKPLTDIRINASVQDVCRQFFYVSGGSRIRGLKMNLRGRNNTDGEGWIGAAGVAAATADDDGYTPIIGAGDQLAGELHYLAGDNEVTLDLSHVGSTGPTIGSTSQGSLKLSIKANDVGINLINDIVYQQAGGMLDRLDLVIDVDSDLSSINSHARIDRITDLQGFNGGLSLRMLGRGSLAGAPAASAWFNGPSSTTLVLAGSGSPICNLSTMPINIGIRDSGGVVTGLSVCKVIRSWAKACTAVDTVAKTLTIAGDVTAQYTTGRHVVFFGLQGSIPEYDLTGANPISAVSYSGGVTTVTLSNTPPALGTFDTVAPVATNAATALPAPYSRFIELMPGRALIPTYTATPNAVIAVPSIQ